MTFTQKMQERAREKMMGSFFKDETVTPQQVMDVIVAQTIADTVAEIEGRLMGEKNIDGEVASATGFPEAVDYGHNTYRTHTLEVLNEVKK